MTARGFYVSAGLIEDSHHQQRIGPALWEFLWLISHETKEGGKVLNGSPVTAVRIAADLGRHVNTVRANLARLEKQGYIVREMGQSSVYHFRISNTKKWQHPTENCEPVEATAPQKTVSLVTENCEPGSQKTVSLIRKIDNIDSKTKNKTYTRAKRVSLPEAFGISNRIRAWAVEKGFDRLEEHLAHFVGYAKAHGAIYADWDQAFQNAIRDNWAKLKPGGNGTAKRKNLVDIVLQQEAEGPPPRGSGGLRAKVAL